MGRSDPKNMGVTAYPPRLEVHENGRYPFGGCVR